MSNQSNLQSRRARRHLGAFRPGQAKAGFSLVELMVVFTIMTIALSMFSRTLTSASRLDPLSREKSAASEAAQNIIETMRGYEFSDVYKSFNLDPADDPGGAGTKPGKYFTIDGMTPATEGGNVGEIVFCDFEGKIYESAELTEFGLPRDLSGDGVVDRQDHTNDCILLPFKILIQWDSRFGARKFEMYGVLSNL